jgi:glycerol-3-phosphate dehydrogenase (NAD(P)+)
MLEFKPTLGVLGAGAWGTALAATAARAGHKVLMWDRDPLVVEDINRRQRNSKRFGETALPEGIGATGQLAELAEQTEVIIVALPSEANVVLAGPLAAYLTPRHSLVLAAKGFRESDGALLDTVWREAAPQVGRRLVLAGPTFAREVMDQKPTAMLLACPDVNLRLQVAEYFAVPWVRTYDTTDVVGAQVGGALKNVLAIAAGILDGLELGHNARAAMLCRGLAEMGRFAKAMGGDERTIYGLGGMGDLLLTSTSQLSRNMRFGQLVGKGVPIAEAKLRIGTVEGLMAARIVTVQAQTLGVDVAIMSAIDGILHGDVTPLQAVEYLMARPRKMEAA